MKTFKELVEGKVEKGLDYREIVKRFDKIDDVVVEPDGVTVRVRGEKSGKFADYYGTYTHNKVAKEVAKKLENFIGVSEADIETELMNGLGNCRKDLTDVSKEVSEIGYHSNKNKLDKLSKFSKELQKEIDSLRDKIVKFERSY